MYQDRAVAFSRWNLGITGGHGTKDIWLYDGQKKIDGFAEKQSIAGITVGRRLFGQSSVALNISTSQRHYETLLEFPERVAYQSISLGPTLRWEDSNFHFYFNEGYTARLTYAKQVARNDHVRSSENVEAFATSEMNIYSNHALQLQVNAGSVTAKDERDLIRKGGGRGFRGSPTNGLWLKRYAAFSADYQIPILQAEYGTYTVAPFAEYAVVDRWMPNSAEDAKKIEDWFRFGSGGFGTYLFLKQIAIPGVGLQFGRCSAYLPFFVSFALGMSF